MSQYQWFALYTKSLNEKKVYVELQHLGIEVYLPMVTKWRQWSDRKKKIDVPLFRSYIFVKVSELEYFKVLNTPGVVRFITFEGKAVAIPENQIIAIRQYLNEFDEISEEEEEMKLQEGQLVRIKTGPMEGLIGKMLKYKNKMRLMINIESIGHVITLNIQRSKVEPIKN